MIDKSISPVAVPGSKVRVVFHEGALERLGAIAREQGATRALLVSDPGIVEAGHVETAMRSLYQAGIVARLFDGVAENPTTEHVHRGLAVAKKFNIDFIIGLGGGSSMDCAKGINFLLTNGGQMKDYWGVGKATQPMLPLIAIPTTAGTGSEAQCAALITDPQTHVKMACLDEKVLARIAILDPLLTATAPRSVAAATGIDAIAHAVETSASTRRNEVSRKFSKAAWQLLSQSFAKSLSDDADDQARQDMLLGAHLAGCAIENSMLGAAHACANPLTARFGIIHGHAVGLMLPHVVRFNSQDGQRPYEDLDLDAERLAQRIESFRAVAGLPGCLKACGVPAGAIGELAQDAAQQWTATFNPRPVQMEELARIYQMAQ